MLYWKKELEMLSKLFKAFGMKEIKAVFDVYPCDSDMAKKRNSILFQLGREIMIGEKSFIKFETGPGADSSCL